MSADIVTKASFISSLVTELGDGDTRQSTEFTYKPLYLCNWETSHLSLHTDFWSISAFVLLSKYTPKGSAPQILFKHKYMRHLFMDLEIKWLLLGLQSPSDIFYAFMFLCTYFTFHKENMGGRILNTTCMYDKIETAVNHYCVVLYVYPRDVPALTLLL